MCARGRSACSLPSVRQPGVRSNSALPAMPEEADPNSYSKGRHPPVPGKVTPSLPKKKKRLLEHPYGFNQNPCPCPASLRKEQPGDSYGWSWSLLLHLLLHVEVCRIWYKKHSVLMQRAQPEQSCHTTLIRHSPRS